MTFINLTPHAINILGEGRTLAIEPSGQLARVSARTETIGEIDGIPVTTTVYGEVEGLPESRDGVAYIVSSLVAQRVTHREDVFVPSESVRDERGRIVGCRSLGRVR